MLVLVVVVTTVLLLMVVGTALGFVVVEMEVFELLGAVPGMH